MGADIVLFGIFAEETFGLEGVLFKLVLGALMLLLLFGGFVK